MGGSPRRPRQVLAGIALTVAALLLVVVAAQGFLLVRLNDKLDDANRAADQRQRDTNSRISGLESRARKLERQAGTNLDAAAVAADVTPSVFKVVAGRASGTAFAFGKAPSGGGTDLVTNYHVVSELMASGRREVVLERDNKRFTAKVTKNDSARDLATLHSDQDFPRLNPATEAAKPGEPVLVVGAPLGLESTITTGVVSAQRNTTDGPRVQFDAAINPGNSGGPVINAQKQVVGVATAKVSEAENVGLAIPVAVVCETLGFC